ncbi:MAG: inositol monophosphatase family protein [Spirochaetia bacterium]
MDKEQLRELIDFAEKLAGDAGKITLKYFKSGVQVELKQDRTPVTIADRETEQYIRNQITDRYPDHSVVGEEHGAANKSSEWKWIIDPIDGTKAFIHGIPLYTVLIGLVLNDVPVAGIIHNPVLEETVAAGTGLGCTLNGSPCKVSTQRRFSESKIHATDAAHLYTRYPDFTRRLLSSCGSLRTWADGYGYLLVASGRADGMLDPIMSLWDIAPLKPVIKEAGGVFTSITGKDENLGTSAAAGNPFIHAEILKCHEES